MPDQSEPFLINKTPVSNLIQSQLRIWLAAAGGAIATAAANKLQLPVLTDLWGQQSNEIVGTAVGAIMLAGMSAWQAARTWMVNQRWWQVAIDPKVPNSVVAPHPSEYTKGNV